MKAKYIGMLLGVSLLFTGCDNFLDREPQDKMTPEKYFTSEADLAAYSVNLYNFTSVAPGSYGVSVYANDNNTDNQAAVSPSNRWDPGQLLVGYTNPWDFTQVRNCNYFFSQVMPKFKSGSIAGSSDNIRHYIGEMYLLRAYAYFSLLQNIGDCPIITQPLPDEAATLLAASERQPRNKVARFILADLDTAAIYLKPESPSGKNRITRDVALLLHSRVALYEGTFEKHHAGTAFVPGGKGWPGKDAQGYDNAAEVRYFLSQAMKSSKVLGDKMVGKLAENTDTPEGMNSKLESINPYYTMFCDKDMETYDEVLMWRKYDPKLGVSHNIQMQLERNGGGTGWTRGLVNSFLMQNGLPIYAANSGYQTQWETEGVDATLQNRDSRIRIFTKGDHSVDCYLDNGDPIYYEPQWVMIGNEETRTVTGYALKKGKDYPFSGTLHSQGTSGYVVFRGAEALLNYMEASYELNGNIDATAAAYWKALRQRAKVDGDYQKTINATVMSEEAKGDWGAYSHGKLVDQTLYNIRRERRNEMIGEGMRWADLVRWRALDQVKNYQIEGMRFWGTPYANLQDADGKKIVVVDKSGEKGNMSPQEVSVYIRPYQIKAVNNRFYNGYNFTPAHYLVPLPQSVFRKTTTDNTDLKTSVIYQNPGWGMVDGEPANTVE